MSNGHAICEPVESALVDALKAALRLLDETPLDHPERANVETIRSTIGKAYRMAGELDWETWNKRS